MKTLIKITALAVLAALAVFSCAPEPELTDVNWKDVTTKYDPGKNSDYQNVLNDLQSEFDISGSLSTAENATNEITITFPASSDFLKGGKAKVETGLRQIISFYHFTKADAPIAGKADNLGAALEYIFVRQNVNVITVKLTKTFVAEDSSVIMKIDGTKYTFAGGNKLDLVGIGKGGTAIYDDYYAEFNVGGASGPTDFVEPGNRGWSLQLNKINPDAADEETGYLTNYPIASLYLNGLVGEDAAIAVITDPVANQLKSGLRIQRFKDGKWNDESVNSTYDPEYNTLNVDTLRLDDLVPIRVMWTGSAPVKTSASYFGVQQYIKILGDNTSFDPNLWIPAYYQTGKVYGPVADVWSKDGRNFIGDNPVVSVYSKDFRDRNVIIDVLFNNGEGITYGDPEVTYWLKNLDQQTFKNNFKIFYFSNGGGSPAEFAFRPDVVYIDIRDFKFISYNPDNEDDIGLNAVRITLDPAFEKNDDALIFFSIGPVIGYEDDKTVFGDPANLMNGFFKVYEAVGFSSITPLTADRWANGELSSADDEVWYSFPVTAGTYYYVWWNDSKQGDGTKTGDVVVGARYKESGSWIFGGEYSTTNVDSGWTSSQYFYANQTGTVEVRVIPLYRSDSYTGTFGIVYSTGNTRPSTTTWPPEATTLTVNEWGDGNIPTSNGEEWFKFTANANPQYIHFSPGTLQNLLVLLYDSNGTRTGNGAYFYDSARYASLTVTSGRTYYIRVLPDGGSYSGTYQIGFNTSYNPPPWKAPASTPLTADVWWEDGYIAASGEEWFRFVATAETQYIHVVPGTLTYLIVELYDSDGNQVRGTSYISSGYISRPVTSGWTYYIKVQPNSGSGTYQIAFNATEARPEGTWTPPDIATADITTLTEGQWENGNIATSDGVQWFCFTATADTQYIHATFGSLTDLYVRIIDSFGDTVGYSTSTRLYSSTPSVSRSVTAGQTYYIRVWPYYSSYSGTYQIAFNTSTTRPDGTWTPDASYTPLIEGQWENGNLESGGEQWFSFMATTDTYNGQYIHAVFGTLNDFYVQLHDSYGDTVGYSTELYGSNRSTPRSVTAGETYYIRVWPYSSSYSGTYEIAFNASNTPPAWSPSSYTPLTEGVWSDGELAAGGEQWFSFTATTSAYSGQYIHAAFGSLNDWNMQLYNSTGGMVEGQTTMSSNYSSSRTVASGNTYYIRVWPYNSGDSGTYKITFNTSNTRPPITTLSLDDAIPLTVNVWEDGTIAAGGEQWFSFTATAYTHYIHFIPGTLTNLYVQLYSYDDGAGYMEGSQTRISDSTRSISRTVVSGYTYYIRVLPTSGYSGDYQIAFNTSNTRPWIEPLDATTLTSGVWANGNIATAGGEQWFGFTATAATQYIHITFGTLTDFYVQLYTSTGTTIESATNMYYSTRSASRTVTLGSTYYIKVWPSGDAEDSGTYQIAFNTSNTAP